MQIHFSSTALTQAERAGPAEKKPTAEDDQRLRELQRRDREVRAHEQAHKAAAGAHASGGPTYEYTRGPDGKLYATSGEVPIDTSEVAGDPEATIRKMQQLRQAALAPSDPSSADRSIAATAAQKERAARTESREEPSDPIARYEETDAPTKRGSHVDVTA